VHTAPGHGNEDYLTGIKYKLDIIMPVDTKGRFDSSTGEFQNMNVYDANKVIIEKLKNMSTLLFETNVRHSYPHCWRCKSPIIFRATKQWFLNLEHKESNTAKPLKERLLDAIEEVTWIPAAGKERISAMVKERPDWCLSRQRYWGVPIPALVCNQCHEEFLEPKVIDKFANFVKTGGSDVWFERDLKDFLPKELHCPYCKGRDFSKGTDILDVWFDSGVSHQAVLKKRDDLGGSPCALYLEGSDQHRGWFQSSLIPSMCIDNKPPFKAVLTHGFVVDAEGRKMSKSLGNVISPFDIIKEYGADILRLWVASSDYNEDIRISSEILSRLTEAYRKIRNTARFILSNLYDFNPDIDRVNYIDLRRIDKWILYRLEWVLDFVTNAYGTEANPNFEFYKAYKGIYDFCNGDLSMYYLDMVKGRLYTYAGDSLERRAAQTTIYEVLNVLTRIMAPLLVFTAEEIWQHMPKEKKDRGYNSVHLLGWPKVNPTWAQHDVSPDENIEKELAMIIELIPEVSKALELKRAQGIIGSSFDAKINMLTKDDFCYKYLESFKLELCEIFKVSQIEIIKKEDLDANLFTSSKYPNIAIEVVRAEGDKCQRCWNYSLSVAREDEPLCERCLSIVRKR
jgi:isoleucyl-tRNA synthetase